MAWNLETERFVAEQKYKCDRLLDEGMPIFRKVLSRFSKISSYNYYDNGTGKYQLKSGHSLAKTNIALNGSDIETGNRRCPASFDGLLCWPYTDAPGTAILPCPNLTGYSNLAGDSLRAPPVASKVCLANGEWYRNWNGVTWSNYSLCVPNSVLYLIDNADEPKYPRDPAEPLLNRWLPIIRLVSQIGYATSFITLIVAMVVFSLLRWVRSLPRKLRNPRNRLHMHLFASFIMRAFMALLKDWIFIDGIGLAWDVVFVDGKGTFVKEHSAWICKVITSLWQYFIVANYSWILMEGLYLHNLVFLALCADTSTIALYILLGWGLPALIVVPWVIIRITIEDTFCWTINENPSLFLVIRIPIMVSILLNFVLFLNIVRVLLVKLRTSVHLQQKKMQYKLVLIPFELPLLLRWAKSTLVLVPLFGAHYTFFLGLSYHKDYDIELVWLFCDQLFASFQGAFVALLYCLLNGEVRAEVRRAWKARRSKTDVLSFVSGHRELWRNSRNKSKRRRYRSEGDEGNNIARGIAMREFVSVP